MNLRNSFQKIARNSYKLSVGRRVILANCYTWTGPVDQYLKRLTMRINFFFLMFLGTFLLASVKELSGTGENEGAEGLIIFVNKSPGEVFLHCGEKDFVIATGDSLSLPCKPGHSLTYSGIAKGPYLLPVDLGSQELNSVSPGSVQRILLNVPEDYVFITLQNQSADTIRQVLFYASANAGSRLAGRVEGLNIAKTDQARAVGYFPPGFDKLVLSCSPVTEDNLPESSRAWFFGDFSGLVYPVPHSYPLPVFKHGPNQVMQLHIP